MISKCVKTDKNVQMLVLSFSSPWKKKNQKNKNVHARHCARLSEGAGGRRLFAEAACALGGETGLREKQPPGDKHQSVQITQSTTQPNNACRRGLLEPKAH